MINFKEELLKYQPALELDDIEQSIQSTQLQDIHDMLKYVLSHVNGDGDNSDRRYKE